MFFCLVRSHDVNLVENEGMDILFSSVLRINWLAEFNNKQDAEMCIKTESFEWLYNKRTKSYYLIWASKSKVNFKLIINSL